MKSSKIIQNHSELEQIISRLRTAGNTIVFTNGCFDILHPGHNKLIDQAADSADVLIMGINDDDSVKRLKGDSRPVNSVEKRMEALAKLEKVDFLVSFSEDTPENLIHQIKPNVLVKGGDYTIKQIIGADFVSSYGGQVLIIDLLEGHSTTSIIEKMKK